jgi:hypothetical protein
MEFQKRNKLFSNKLYCQLLFLVFVWVSPMSASGALYQTEKSVENRTVSGLYTASEKSASDENASLYSDNLRKADTGDGDSFEDSGAGENTDGSNDPVSLEAFPYFLLILLALGYGMSKKKNNEK